MNHSLSCLSESVVENGKSILAATHIRKEEGTRAHRIVLRYDSAREEYVVHLETLVNEFITFERNGYDDMIYVHDGYHNGYYTKDFERALAEFTLRSHDFLERLLPLRKTGS